MRSPEANREDRSRAEAKSIELRIHGVGGTTPEVLLKHPHPVQVAGDDTAGFYRPPDSDSLEAYSWGGITSRSGSRAFWLLLLPFALTNAAGFMLTRGDSRRMRLARALLRLIAMAVTVLFVLWVGGLALDLIAYQCGATAACYGNHWWLTFFKYELLATHPSRRIAIAMLMPAAVIWAMRRASSFTRTRYEEAFAMEPVEEPVQQTAPLDIDDPTNWAGLSDRVFWHSAQFGMKLTAAHIGAATASLAGATAYSMWRLREDAGLSTNLDYWLIVLATAVGVLSAIALVFAGKGPVLWLPKVGWLLVAGVAALNFFRSETLGTQQEDLPGYNRAALLTGLAALTLAVILMMVLIGTGRGRLIPPVATTSIGVFAMGVLLAGSHVRLADVLGDRTASTDQAQIFYSAAYDWFALASLAVLSALALTAIAAVIWLGRQARSPKVLGEIGKRYPTTETDEERRSWLASIARQEAISHLMDRADVAMTVTLGIVLGGAIAFYGVRTIGSGSPIGPIKDVPEAWRVLIPLATWIASVLPLIAFGTMYGSFRNPGTRRKVGVVWDVATFWPRWFHPLAPPPYSARAVPELGLRLRRLTDLGASVTLSAHSQGSIVAASALARLPVSIRSSLRLVTHGSPLVRLYGRFFSAYFGPGFISNIQNRVGGRWVNLFRRTDPIGGPIGMDEVDVPCLDPETDQRQIGDPLPKAKGHAFYAGSVCYEKAIERLRGDQTSRA